MLAEFCVRKVGIDSAPKASCFTSDGANSCDHTHQDQREQYLVFDSRGGVFIPVQVLKPADHDAFIQSDFDES